MITLPALIKAAPLNEDTRKTLLEKWEKKELDNSQILQLTELCWTQIIKVYQVEWSLIVERMIAEESTGAKRYTRNDYTEERLKLSNRLITELEATGSEKEMEEVRKRLNINANPPAAGGN